MSRGPPSGEARAGQRSRILRLPVARVLGIALTLMALELASDDIFRTRFPGESRIVASMDHPNVIPIHDMGSSGGPLPATAPPRENMLTPMGMGRP